MAEAAADTAPDNGACPRCGGGFHCGALEGHCACFDLRLTAERQAELARDYPGQCLCLRCLATLAASADTGLPSSLGTPTGPTEKK